MMAMKQEPFVWNVQASELGEVSEFVGDPKRAMMDPDGFLKPLLLTASQEGLRQQRFCWSIFFSLVKGIGKPG